MGRRKLGNTNPNQMIDPEPQADERRLEASLRPRSFGEYIGQKAVVEKLRVYVAAARKRNEALDHCLFSGPPGLGKTSLAHIIATELGVSVHVTSGPAIEKKGDLAGFLTNLSPGDVLFIDEIHRLNASVEEVLYPAMEDYALDIIIGKGPSAHSIRLDLPRFTLIGATTRMGLLTSPLRDRFGIKEQLELYAPEDLQEIIRRSADILHIEIDGASALEIAGRSRGTPRIVNRLLKRVRDYAQVRGNGSIDLSSARAGLEMLAIDELGLDKVDRRMLLTMIEKFGGRPVGLDTIAAATGEDATTIEDVYEPYLLQLGLIARTPRGRMVLPAGYAHMGYAPRPAEAAPVDSQQQQRLAVADFVGTDSGGEHAAQTSPARARCGGSTPSLRADVLGWRHFSWGRGIGMVFGWLFGEKKRQETSTSDARALQAQADEATNAHDVVRLQVC